MKSRRRNLRRRGGTSKFWGYAQGLRNRLGSMSFNGRKQPREQPNVVKKSPHPLHPVAANTYVHHKEVCRENDPDETRKGLPIWYHEKIFYYTGHVLRVLDVDEKKAYRTAREFYDNSTTKKKISFTVSNKDGKTYSFYVDSHHNFYIQMEHEDERNNINYRIVDLEKLMITPAIKFTKKLYDTSHDEDGNLQLKNNEQTDTEREIHLDSSGNIVKDFKYGTPPESSHGIPETDEHRHTSELVQLSAPKSASSSPARTRRSPAHVSRFLQQIRQNH